MARGARRRATPEAPPGGPCADPGNPRGLPKPVCLNRCFFFYPPGRDRFADSVIHPLFHYSPPSVETGLGVHDWEGYKIVNAAYCDALLKEHARGDLVWINDYPLMLLPKLLRAERPEITIGFYMHCVFPSSEVYRILPQREELLRGILSSNIIGFHNFQYVRHFLTSCTRVLGLECSANSIEACEDAGGTCTKVLSVPLGIDIQPFQHILDQDDTRMRIQALLDSFKGLTILAAIDRLEEKKGIPHKIMAFHKFLQREPAWAHKCVFVQIVVLREEAHEDDPGDLSDDRHGLLQQVYQMAGEVNSKFGSIGHLPFHFLCQEFKKVDVAALLCAAHVFVDTPLRDTLSQPAHEYLYCQKDKNCGVLIMSEFSGSAQSLRAAAICVNPWDTGGFADALQEALEMDVEAREELHRYGHKYVVEYTLSHWAMNFLEELQTAEHETESERLQIPPPLEHDLPVTAWRKAKRRLVVLGFAGTLLPRSTKVHAKILPKLPSVLHSNLQVIAEDPNTEVVVVSGYGRQTVAHALVNVPCWIIAESGVCYRKPGEDDFVSTLDEEDLEWLGPVRDIMDYFTARTPGSNVVETASSISWHYQKTQGDHGALQSKDLLIHLWAGPLLSAPAEVIVGTADVTVRPTGVTKSSQLESVIQQICGETLEDGTTRLKEEWRNNDSIVFSAADLNTRDEDMFALLHKMFESAQEIPDDDKRSLGAIERGLQSEAEDGWRPGAKGWTSPPQLSSDEVHMEANSKSLNEVYSSLNMVATGKSIIAEIEDQRELPGLFGLHGSPNPSSSNAVLQQALLSVLKRTGSEPDSHAYQGGVDDCLVGEHAQEQWPSASFDGDAVDQGTRLYSCTINRKATRAMYHLTDTNDLAFLMAKIAREVRQSKEVVTDSE
ncbi:unnamed protein product [Prorocentrum cordatum]|uniref:Alpha,alpha-trehalose-phosphate synthase (UDP-forming) n=1 Tax=Prorocentrum cordatum TaxID=2364126 RepID=A0ABN9ULU4_9DINO|nr:unnamed protein product [Polarella glacialis]